MLALVAARRGRCISCKKVEISAKNKQKTAFFDRDMVVIGPKNDEKIRIFEILTSGQGGTDEACPVLDA